MTDPIPPIENALAAAWRAFLALKTWQKVFVVVAPVLVGAIVAAAAGGWFAVWQAHRADARLDEAQKTAAAERAKLEKTEADAIAARDKSAADAAIHEAAFAELQKTLADQTKTAAAKAAEAEAISNATNDSVNAVLSDSLSGDAALADFRARAARLREGRNNH